METDVKQCPSQYHGAGCGRPAGHSDAHYSADRLAGWMTSCETARAAWKLCGVAHPTAGVRCSLIDGHKGEHGALTVPTPDGEPTSIRGLPFVTWGKTRRSR
jgi:hypothetical protein